MAQVNPNFIHEGDLWFLDRPTVRFYYKTFHPKLYNLATKVIACRILEESEYLPATDKHIVFIQPLNIKRVETLYPIYININWLVRKINNVE